MNVQKLHANWMSTMLLALLMSFFSLNVSAQKESISLNLKNESIKKFIHQVEQQTHYTFVYRDAVIEPNAKVTIVCTNTPIRTVLSKTLSPHNISYTFSNNTIVLTKQEATRSAKTAQAKGGNKHRVKGKVTDSNGEPIIGASVFVKGTTSGAVTDINGVFSLDVADNDIVSISYIGYAPQEMAVRGHDNLAIVMQEDAALKLNEVVVVGYGTVKKADLASSISVLDNKNFKDQPIINVADVLQGRVSGVSVENSSVPGGKIKVRVRGTNSINRSNDPLYVIDGVVRESGLDGLNADDIASMQILKDASSTAIYGSRGSNGVVLITTKTGKANQKIISFESQLTSSSVYKRYKTLSPFDYATAYREIKNAKAFTDEEMTTYQNGTAGIDWQDELFRQALTQNYKITVSNGSEHAQYYISGNIMKQEGIVDNTSSSRYQLRGNISNDITPWLHISLDINGSRNKRQGVGFGASKGNPIWVALNYSPTMEMMDENGIYNKDPYNSITNNPIGNIRLNGSQNLFYVVNGTLELRFKILPNLTFTTTNGIDYYDSKVYSSESKRVFPTNSMSNSNNNRVMLQSSNILTYNLTKDKHNLTLTGVYEYSTSETRGMGFNGTNLYTESVGWWDVNMATTHTLSNQYSQWKLMSGVGRAVYDYDHRYIVTGTIRADGSSKFSKKKWGYFPSVAVAWNFGQEKFMEKQKLISDAKLRLSYGLVGNQAIAPYSTLGLMSQTSYAFGGTTNYTGYWSKDISTPELTWEKTKQFDLGLDFSLLNNRISVSIDYFNKNTIDCLLKKQIPNYNGGGTTWINAGKINNQGVDFSVSADILRGNVFNWRTSATATYLKNTVKSLGGDEFLYGTSPANGLMEEATIIKPGHPVGSFYGYTWLGLDEKGNNKFADTNENGVIDSGDRTIIGKSTPDVTVGWNNSLSYKNWSLNVFFNGAFGLQKLNLVRFGMASMAGDTQFVTLYDAYWNGYDKVGAGATYPSLLSKTNKAQPASTQWLESANYMRLENLSLSYNLSKQVTHFADIILSLSAQNLFTFTGYKGMDPTSSSFASNVDIDNGIDIGAYPHPRSFTFGIKLNF